MHLRSGEVTLQEPRILFTTKVCVSFAAWRELLSQCPPGALRHPSLCGASLRAARRRLCIQGRGVEEFYGVFAGVFCSSFLANAA